MKDRGLSWLFQNYAFIVFHICRPRCPYQNRKNAHTGPHKATYYDNIVVIKYDAHVPMFWSL